MTTTDGSHHELEEAVQQALAALANITPVGTAYGQHHREVQMAAHARLKDALAKFSPHTVPHSGEQDLAFELKAVTFDYLAEEDKIPAYLNGQTWNGWRMPYFPESSMPQLMRLCPNVSYDPANDAYIVRPIDDPEDISTFPAETITTADGQGIKVYAVGAGYWTWDEAD